MQVDLQRTAREWGEAVPVQARRIFLWSAIQALRGARRKHTAQKQEGKQEQQKGQILCTKCYFRIIVSLISHFVNLGRPKIPVRGGNAPRYRSLWRYHASPHARSRVTKTTPRAVHRPHKFLPPRYSCSPRTARRTSGCFLCPPWPTCSAPPSGAALLTTAVAEIPRVRHTPPLSRTSTAARHSISPSPPASRV